MSNSNKIHKARFRRRSEPSSASDILERTLNIKRLSKKLKRFSIFTDWVEIVGESIADIAQPKKIVRGSTLLVEVIDPVWVQELSLQKTSLLQTLNDSCESVLLDDIQFVSGNPKQFDKHS